MQTAIQTQTGEEIDVGRLYAGYRRLVDGTPALRQAGDQLAMLNRYPAMEGASWRDVCIGKADACEACLLRAESGAWVFVPPRR